MKNLRDDPLLERFSRGTISEGQFRSGRAYQRDWEQAGGAGVRAIDFTKEAVDGGAGRSDGLSVARMESTDRLGVVHHLLGKDGTVILQDVLVRGYTLAWMASSRGLPKSWDDYFGKRFVSLLDEIAVIYGHAMRARG